MNKPVKKIEGIPVESLSVLNLKPDDVLLVKVPAMMDKGYIDQIEKRLSDKIGCKVVAFDPCFEAQAILRAEKKDES
ncbi:MAG TPA: hypothetical protein VHO71_04660 [Caproiciproducens sp.]|nr:hypothetical protein [Caproiciproducens sp.]